MRDYKKIQTFFILFFIVNNLIAQLNPFVINFSKKTHQANSQNWSVSSNGLVEVYFGNNKGLLRYNGNDWKLEYLPKRQEVFSVEVFDDKSKIFIGSYEEFGYFQKDLKGKFSYISLSDSIDQKDIRNTAVWNIVQDSNGDILFQTFPRLFRFRNNTVEIIDSIKSISNIRKVRDEIFIQSFRKGIYKLENDKFIKIDLEGLNLDHNPFRDIVAFKDNSYILGYTDLGLLQLKDNHISVWNTSVNNVIKNKQINSLVWDGSYLYVGTVLGGLYIIDNDGLIVNVINTQSNLFSNNIHDLSLDNKGNLWLALDSDVSYLDTKYPLHFITDIWSKTGITQDIVMFEGKTYLATNQGLFVSSDNTNIDNFKMIESLEGQTWSLNIVDNQLFCGHSKGLYEIIDGKPILIKKVKGAFNSAIIKVNDINTLIINSSRSMLLLRKNHKNRWEYYKTIKYNILSHQMVVDLNENIWLSHYRKGTIYKLKVNISGSGVSKDIMGLSNGLPKKRGLEVFKSGNRVVIPTDNGFYTYDDFRDTIVPYLKLNKELGELYNANQIIDNGIDKWVVKLPEISLFKNTDHELEKVISFRFSNTKSVDIPGRTVNIRKLEDGNTYISLMNGFAIYEPLDFFEQNYNTPIFINSISTTDGIDTINYLINQKETDLIPTLENDSNLSIVYSSLSNPGMDIWYETKLEGLENDWHKTKTGGVTEYKNIPSGKYTFYVRAVNSMGVKLPEVSYRFKVAKPWYLQWYVVLIVFIVLLLGFIFVRLFIVRNIADRKSLLAKTAKALFEKERIEKQLKSLELENTDQSRELTKYSMELMRNNETLLDLKTELSKIASTNKKDRSVIKAMSKVDKNLEHKDDAQSVFNYHFDQSNIKLSNALKNEFPDLSPGDLRLSSYLRHNMSSKEIAEILHVSVRSIEVKRYRLRKKLGLDKSVNLSEFIIQYNI